MAVDESGNVEVSTSPATGSWTSSHIDESFGRIGYIKGVSCPTTSLCVAVDGFGDAVETTEPTGGASKWHSGKIDVNNNLTAISCTTESLCVAVDQSGHVLTTTKPTGGASEWTATKVDTAELTGISCAPTGRLCVAVDASGNAITSSNPTGGAEEWHTASLGYLRDVSCPTTSLCVAAGATHGFIVSTDPNGGAGTWKATEPTAFQAIGVTCASASFCIGTGLFEDEEEEDFVSQTYLSTNPTASSWLLATTVGEGPWIASTCASASFCAGITGGEGHADSVLIGTPKIEEGGGGGKAPEKVVTKEEPKTTTTEAPKGGVATTPTPGSEPAPVATITSAEISSFLAGLHSPSGATASIASLLRHSGYSEAVKSLEAGKLTISWYEVPKGAKISKSKPKPVLVATGTISLSAAGSATFKLKLTAVGKGLLKKGGHVKLTSKSSFTPVGKPAITSLKTFTVSGKP